MEIIQASGNCSSQAWIHPSLPHQFSSLLSTRIRLQSRLSPISILSVKPKIPSHNELISTTTRAILENGSSDSVATKSVVLDTSFQIKKRAGLMGSDLKGTSIFLVGINSSYKMGVGKLLADAFLYSYLDSDDVVEEAAGGKTATISYIESDKEGYLATETEVLKQLSAYGRLIVSAGNGAVKSVTNLALLRHGISIWIDVPLDLVARDIMEDRIQLSASDMTMCKSSSEVLDQLATLYNIAQSGYSTADATVSLLKVASRLGVDELDAVTAEDLCLEALKEIEKLLRVKKMMEEAGRLF